jgi:hypothetical protein
VPASYLRLLRYAQPDATDTLSPTAGS